MTSLHQVTQHTGLLPESNQFEAWKKRVRTLLDRRNTSLSLQQEIGQAFAEQLSVHGTAGASAQSSWK